jgi:hypothetical protein
VVEPFGLEEPTPNEHLPVTIIVSIISDHGLIQASDSNLTGSASSGASFGKKVFRLGFGRGALALAGMYEVWNERMDTWMPSCIRGYAASTDSPTQEGFADYLTECLNNTELTTRQRNCPTTIQIVGYVSDGDGVVHPALHHVRNTSSINASTGAYEGIGPFVVSEDFWSRDYPADPPGALVGPGRYWSYFNGTPDGRIAFYEFMQRFDRFLRTVWSQPGWKFREPQSLGELASIVDLQIRTIGALYGISDYHAPLVGGKPQICKIRPPRGAVR